MNKEINQKISQFLDDELHPTEQEVLLLKVKQQPEFQKTMNRYQTMRQVLRSEDVLMVSEGFLDKINQELEQDPHYFLPNLVVKKRPISFWQKTSVAVAASVAIVVVMVSQQGGLYKTGLQNTQSQLQVVAQEQAAEQQVVVVNKSTSSQHERLKAYLQAHSDDLYTHGSLNVHPLAHVASFGQD